MGLPLSGANKIVMSLLLSGLPSTVTLPVTSARRSPQPEHASNALSPRRLTSLGRDMVRLAWTLYVRALAKVIAASGHRRLASIWPFPGRFRISRRRFGAEVFHVTVANCVDESRWRAHAF